MEAVGEQGGLSIEITKQLADVKAGYTYFRDGDIVIAKITPCFENGKGALAAGLTNGIAFGTTELHVLRMTERADRRFALYLTLSDPFRRLGEADMYGAGGQKRISESFVRNFSPALPPLPEQRAIAAFLDRETARLDALVAKKEQLTELLQEQRTALITRAVTKGLDPTVPMKDSGVEWLGEIPEHWEVKRLRHLVARIEQGWSPECENREADDDEWGVLKAGCVNRGTFLESEHKALPAALPPIASLEISEGDLLMSRASGSRELVGSVAVVPKCRPRLLLCDKVFRLHPTVKRADRFFMAYAMNSASARSQIEVVLSGGSGLANNIAQEVVKDLLFAQPWLPEQRAIVAFLDRETARIDAFVAKVHEAIDRLKEFRNALISAAVTGKIDVREAVA
jgi:type I restriction enzyme S subunit